MTEQELRSNAAQLAREIRAMERKGDWSIRQWNRQVRLAVRGYMRNTLQFLRSNA
jgi:hypothetical protein